MNEKLLSPARIPRIAGRFLAVAALGSLLVTVAGCSQSQLPGGASTSPGSSQEATADSSAENSPPGNVRDVVEQSPDASAADALAAAQQIFSGGPTKIALDYRIDGPLEYDIELVSASEKYEVSLNADTLAVLEEEREPLEPGDDDQQQVFDFGAVIDVNKAAATARQAQPGNIVEWNLEGDRAGVVVYEFDVLATGAKDDIEVRVNALTNELLPRG